MCCYEIKYNSFRLGPHHLNILKMFYFVTIILYFAKFGNILYFNLETQALFIAAFFSFYIRCFALIDSSTLEQTREEMETEKMTHLESLVELGLSSTFSTILTQCSLDIFKVEISFRCF